MSSFRTWLGQIVWFVLVVTRAVSAGLACLSNPCQHGICIDDINSTYSCYCVDGYTGVQCQTNWDECWSAPCQNGGTCSDGVAAYNCSCPEGFIGDNCEVNYDECESNPCLNNGTCVDLTNGYVCSCMAGYSGSHCELDVAVCNSSEEIRCHNGGQCSEGPGFKFYCKCLPGWTGLKCEEAIDECKSNPCLNGGVCIDVHADYMCACTFGYTGKSCEVQIEFCEENSCSNNAICVVEDSTRVCYCVPDYHGERCELQYDECQLGPRCMNGGTCIDGVDNFTCSCPPQLTGALCECLILDNNELDCQYISPTPPPSIENVTLTSTYDQLSSTTEITYVTIESETTIINTTITPAGPPDIPTVAQEPVESTSEEIIEIDTTEQVSTGLIEIEESTTEIMVISTDTVIEQTLDSEHSITETTTEFCESCQESTTEITVKLPQLPSEITTISTMLPTEKEFITTDSDTGIDGENKPTTTSIMDTTTEKMFTDSPTEQVPVDITTLATYTTTETLEITTTSYDNTTIGYTTAQSECADSICNHRGTCINTPHGARCICNFHYGGRFCEERIYIKSAAFGANSYIIHKLRNDTSQYIEFIAKTLITDGQIMYVDIAKGIYMQLYMSSGLLKFKFSCGYQTMLLSELKTFVNKGFPMKIETRLDLDLAHQLCNATLRLNDTVAMSGGQVANFSTLLYNTTLYLGNAPHIKDPDSKPFVGCIRDLSVNGEHRQIYSEAFDASELSECSSLSCLSGPCLNGGTCQDHGSTYSCACANGWTGSHCGQSICEHNPCQYGGSCVHHVGSGFLCLCPYGKHGIFCEYNVDITRPSLAPVAGGISSYITYPLGQAVNSERFDLRLRFQTTDMDQISLIAFIGQGGHHDSRSQHLAVTFVKGYVMLTWNMGSGSRRIFTPRPLGERRAGHTVRVGRRGRSAWLSVDARFNVSGNAPGAELKMTVTPYLYIGGYPSQGFHDLPHDLPLHSGWRGCIWEVGGASVNGGKAVSGRGVGQCGVTQCTTLSCNAPRGVCVHQPATYGCICNEGWFGATCSSQHNPCDRAVTKCQGRCVITTGEAQCDCPYGMTGANCDVELYPTDVLFTGLRSYARLNPRLLSSVSLALEAEMKPQKARGLVLFASTPHFYTALSLQGALLEYRWTDLVSGMTSVARSGVVLSMGQWHRVKAGRYGSRLYVWVDGTLNTEAMMAHAYPHTEANCSILIGGAADLSTLPTGVMSGPPEAFTGCIRNLHVNNILVPLEKQNIQDGANLGDCDGTPCGAEACGNGVCVVEAGMARCSCAAESGGAGGARCRRHTRCSPTTCAPPMGVCRGAKCICNTGFGGLDCSQKINVTIPHFGGDSLLAVGRRAVSISAASVQQMQATSTRHRPSYVTANFTTAETRGLILWITMDNDYLGLGLENGFLKLVWSFHNENYTFELEPSKTNSISRLVPHAGFLADGEWHVMALSIEANVSLQVDKIVVYSEELGLNRWFQYEHVDVYFGGVSEDGSGLAKRLFPKNFKGCITDIATAEGNFLKNYSQLYSENINSCQLFP